MIHPLRQLKVNQRGRIELSDPPRGADGIVRAVSDDAISLELADTPERLGLSVGQRVTFKYWDLFGLHRGDTCVTELSAPNTLSLAPPEELELTQKRKFYRVHVDLPVTLTIDGEPSAELLVTSEDLTPAGMRFRSTRPFRVGDAVTVRIEVPVRAAGARGPVVTHARVVRVDGTTSEGTAAATRDGSAGEGEGEPETARARSVSVEFVGISEEDQVRIALLLFEVQRRV